MNKLTEGQVDVKSDYFLLTFGSVKLEKPTFIDAALVGKVNDQEFLYQFSDQATSEIKKVVLQDIKFYLVEHGPNSVMENAWEYAKYHASTSSNIYSHVHWNFHPIK